MNLEMSRNNNFYDKERDKLKRSVQSRGDTYSPNHDMRSTKFDSLSLHRCKNMYIYLDNNKFSHINESALSKFESENMNRNTKSTGKINIYNLEENEGETPLQLNYNYDRRYKAMIDEINMLKDENSGLKGMLERKKVRIYRSRKYWKEWKNNYS